MADIFLSYSRTDKPRVAPLVAALEAKGWSVWWDTDLSPGVDFDSVTAEALKSVGAVVVVWTPTSVTSRWVRGEARVGADRGVLVPVRFENAELPIDVRTIHTTDLDDWNGDPASSTFQRLAQSLSALLGGAAPTLPTPSAQELKLPSKPSIAVMPFANLSGDPEQDYFADGMVDEITNALSRFKSLFVIASASTLSFKGKAISPQEVGRQLGVRYVLDGSVRKAGNRIRISVKLIDAADGAQVWSERFDDTLEDVFDLQDKVALAVAGKIEPTVEKAEIRRASARPTDKLGGYDLYLRALPLFRTFGRAEVFKALELLKQAIAMDGDFVPALAMAVSCLRTIIIFSWSEDPERDRLDVLALARKTVQAAGDDATALASVANDLAFVGGDMGVAVGLAKRAVALNPGSASVWFNSGAVQLRAGQNDLAVGHLENAMRLDPSGPSHGAHLVFLACARLFQGRFTEAVGLSKERCQIGESPSGYAILAASLGHLGEIDAAKAALARYGALSPQPIEAFARSTFLDEAQIRMLLDGTALAEGKSPPDAPTVSQ